MKFSLVLAVLCVVCGAAYGNRLSWQVVNRGNGTAPKPRRDAGIAYDPNQKILVLFGGRAGSEIYGDTWVYETLTNKWQLLNTPTNSSPAARFSFVSGISGNYFYVATGEGKAKTFFNDIWRMDLTSKKWEALPARERPTYVTDDEWTLMKKNVVRPAVRYGAAGGIYNGGSRFYVGLGFANRRYADIYSYDVNSKSWYMDFADGHPYDPSYPHARCLESSTMIDADQFVIFGGCLTGGETGGPCPAGDSWIFNARTKMWRQVEGCASPRTYSAIAMLPIILGEKRFVMYGGVEDSKQVITTVKSAADEVAVLDPKATKWVNKKVEGAAPEKRASVAMATGPNGVYMFGGHVFKGERVSNELWLLKGDAAAADSTASSPCTSNQFFNFIMIHGILMALGWGFFLQWGAFIARYLRHKEPLWFNLHRLFQLFGLLCAIGGLVCGVLSVQFDHFKFVHGILGLVVMILGILQPINACCRPKHPEEGEEKSMARGCWEVLHKDGGRIALMLGLVNISLGVFFINASIYIWGAWFAYLALLVLVYLIAEVAKGASETRNKGHSTKTGYSNAAMEMERK